MKLYSLANYPVLSHISPYPILYRIFCILYRIFCFNLYCNTIHNTNMELSMYNYVNLLLCIIISVAFEIQNYNITQRIPDIYSRPDFPSIVVFGWYNFSLFLAAFILVVDTLFCLLQRNSISCWLPSFPATIFFVAVNFFLSITMSFMSI